MASEQTGASTSGGSFDKGSGLASGRTKSGVSTGIGTSLEGSQPRSTVRIAPFAEPSTGRTTCSAPAN
jgi:hypothetical protein